MAATPVDGHTQEFEQLAGLSALHVLEGDELARFERHAAQCEICQVMVRLDREALAQVSLVAPEMDPSPDFKARLMRRAAQELAAEAPTFEAQPPEPVELRPRRPSNVIPLWRRSPWVNAVAAVFVLGIATFGAITYENQPIATVELHGTAPGTAVVVVRRSGAAELEMRGVPDPGPGFIYESQQARLHEAKPRCRSKPTPAAAPSPLPGNVAALPSRRASQSCWARSAHDGFAATCGRPGAVRSPV
jgi:anti-sigma-K factor RskA